MIDRRDFIKAAAALPLLSPLSLLAAQPLPLIKRSIPSSGEAIPAIGMGSYQTFNVASDSAEMKNLLDVFKLFFASGGSLLDSSPMYGDSESVLGELLKQMSPKPKVFSASKVWTYGKQEGVDAIERSAQRMQTPVMDLMQVHNLRDWQVQLKNLNELKAAGKIRYTGITTSRVSQYTDFEQVMANNKLDFVQLNYNIQVQDAAKRLLPLAIDKGIAVIVNMPFEKGRLFQQVKNKPLPEWSKEFDCASWGQFFLKYILSHPATTCAIPATSKVKHMQDNMTAMRGRLPDAKMRIKMANYFASL